MQQFLAVKGLLSGMRVLGFLLLIVISACSNPYRKMAGSINLEKKYEAAKYYYNKQDYTRAQPLFEELLVIYRGTSKGESIYFNYAMTHLQLGTFSEASYHFKNFTDNYPNSSFTEQALFLHAYALALESPPKELDQESTTSAISAFQLFTNRYPNSTRIDSSNLMIDRLRDKLELKAYESAKLYYNLEDYRAAAVAFRTLLKDFPDLDSREEVEFLVFKSYYLWAANSVVEKQPERYALAGESFASFAGSFPQSERLTEANRYNALIKAENEKKKNQE